MSLWRISTMRCIRALWEKIRKCPEISPLRCFVPLQNISESVESQNSILQYFMNIEGVGDIHIEWPDWQHSSADGVAAAVQGAFHNTQEPKWYIIFSGNVREYWGLSVLEEPSFSSQHAECFVHPRDPRIIWLNFLWAQSISKSLDKALPTERDILIFFDDLPWQTQAEKMARFLTGKKNGVIHGWSLQDKGESFHIWLQDGRIAAFDDWRNAPDFYSPVDNSVGANIMLLS